MHRPTHQHTHVHARAHRARRRGLMAAGCAVGVTLAGVAGVAGTASAHVGIAEGEVTAGAYEILTFGVPHGCGDSPTTEVRIQIPESMPTPTPTVNANWDVEKVMETLDAPVDAGHGATIDERVAEVVYTARTPLPNGYRDAFQLSVRIPDDAAGQTLYFPTVQTCEEGETRWIEIPGEGQRADDLESPAPAVAVLAAAGGASDDGPADGAADGAAAGGTETVEAAASADSDDGGTDPLTWVAIVVGGLGVVVGGVALVTARKD
jgi:uncharacterized protein YcnI